MHGTRILLLGLAYKAGTSDWRESPSIAVAERLAALGAELQRVRRRTSRACSQPGLATRARRLHARSRSKPRISSCCSWTTPSSTPDEICRHASLVFDAKGVLRGRTFAGEIL